jgi:hypothetical protein
MIKLKNTEIFGLLSMDIDSINLPCDSAFKIAALINDLIPKIKIYNEHASKIKGDQEKLQALNMAETEYNFEKLTIDDQWPKLSLKEAKILLPLIKR